MIPRRSQNAERAIRKGRGTRNAEYKEANSAEHAINEHGMRNEAKSETNKIENIRSYEYQVLLKEELLCTRTLEMQQTRPTRSVERQNTRLRGTRKQK